MKTRILLPVLLLAGAFAFVATAEDARASTFSPATGKTAVALGPRVHVGVGVTVPVGTRHVHRRGYRRVAYREVVEVVGGYYETRTKEVRVPGEQIGWDMRGRPIFGPERVEVREYRVWVPRREVIRRVPVRRHVHHVRHVRPRGYVTVGGSVRVR